ncbi:MAG: AAA family ATPase [Bacteroidetes bacterium]|nr:AAA family ATPase [Bacteroidota bacterium]
MFKRKNEEEIRKFLDFNIKDLDINNIDALLTQKKEEENLKEVNKILGLSEPSFFTIVPFDTINLLTLINDSLQKDYSDIEEKILRDHINSNFSNVSDAQSWIEKGFQSSKDKNGCPFCGQDLKNATDLIKIYSSYFNHEYQTFIKDIEKELSTKKDTFSKEEFRCKSNFQTVLTNALQYKEFITEKDFIEKLDELTSYINKLDEKNINDEKTNLLENIKIKNEEKSKRPHKKVDILDFSAFESKVKEYQKNLDLIIETIKFLVTKIKEFKKKYKNIDKITEDINCRTTEVSNLKYEKSRIEQDESCCNYKKQEEEKKNLEIKHQQLKKDMEQKQSDYLTDYFEKINEFFKCLGGHKFKLEKGKSNQGYYPVYFLKLKFNDQEIPNEQLKYVFSTSDRRALALAIFCAKIELKEESEKEKTIIILDDPITSFDENRITNTINILEKILNNISQIIILTYYPHFIKRFCEISNNKNTAFIEIKSKETTSVLACAELATFTQSKYEEIFTKIDGFIKGKHETCIKHDLRPFLETFYLPTFFINQLRGTEKDISSLQKMIDAIFEEKPDSKARFHEFRKSLNADAHIFTSTNKLDVQNMAKDMMKFLYSFEFTQKEN